MGLRRNGARTFLYVVQHACRLSRTPGFQTGLLNILGEEHGTTVFAGWEVFCAIIDTLVSTDNWYNQKDHTDDDSDGEDAAPLG